MRGRRLLSVSMVAAGMVALSGGAAPAAAPPRPPEVDGAVQVTADSGAARGHATPVLAVAPEDPQTMVLAEGDAYASRCMVHYEDGRIMGSMVGRTA